MCMYRMNRLLQYSFNDCRLKVEDQTPPFPPKNYLRGRFCALFVIITIFMPPHEGSSSSLHDAHLQTVFVLRSPPLLPHYEHLLAAECSEFDTFNRFLSCVMCSFYHQESVPATWTQQLAYFCRN